VTQAAAVCAVRPIERIIVADRRAEALPRFVETVRNEWPEMADRLETTQDASAAVQASDVVCTATTSKAAVFDDTDVRPGTHINAVGAFTPEMQEIPEATVQRATVVVDNVGACLAEAGDLLKPLAQGLITEEHFRRELGQVVAGSAPGRTSSEEITFFKSVGNAVQDVVVARRAIDRATEMGVGVTLNLM
jgi:ornithine cyclodeaminase